MRVIERRTILERTGTQVHFPFLVESGTGRWFMTYREGPHGYPGGDRVECVMSTDAGGSWQPWSGLEPDPRLRLFCTRLADGSLISHRYHVERNDDGAWVAPILRSRDDGASWVLSESPVSDMPYNRECENHCLWGHIREGAEGELLCGSYGQTGDTPGVHGRMRYTNGVLVSHDMGENWTFLGAVAPDPSLGNEGPNELDLLVLPDGEILSEPTVVATGLSAPEGMAVDLDGNLLVVETGAGRLTRIDLATGKLSTVADGLAVIQAPAGAVPTWSFNGVAVGPSGAIYVGSGPIYRIEPGA